MTDFTKLDKSQWDSVRTRDGRKVRILCTDGPEKWPVIGVDEGSEFPRSWRADGAWPINGREESPLDLILPPEPRTIWLRDYGAGFCPEASQAPLPLEMAHEFANNSGFATRNEIDPALKRAGRIFEGAGTSHYYNNDLINRAQILILALTGNVGYPGCGFDHYVGQEKLWGEDGFFRMSFPNGRARHRFQPTTL